MGVLKENHNECAWCKDAGKIETAVTVHHVQAVKKYPELALSAVIDAVENPTYRRLLSRGILALLVAS